MSDVGMFFRDRNLIAFEEAVVKHLLDRYGLTKPWKAKLLERHRQRERAPGLSLVDFQVVFQRFPIVLCLSDLQRIPDNNRFTHMLTKFDKLPITQEYYDQRDNCGDPDVPFGLLIKWPYLKSGVGAVVLHDFNVDLYSPGQRLSFVASPSGTPLVLETLDSLLDSIDDIEVDGDDSPWFQLAERKLT